MDLNIALFAPTQQLCQDAIRQGSGLIKNPYILPQNNNLIKTIYTDPQETQNFHFHYILVICTPEPLTS